MVETPNGTWIMSTKEYAQYIHDLTGEKLRSPESVAYSCRQGDLNCYREDGNWRVKVEPKAVPYSKYNELQKELESAKFTIASIKKLLN